MTLTNVLPLPSYDDDAKSVQRAVFDLFVYDCWKVYSKQTYRFTILTNSPGPLKVTLVSVILLFVFILYLFGLSKSSLHARGILLHCILE